MKSSVGDRKLGNLGNEREKVRMKEIPLTKGKVTLVDDEDYSFLNQFSWHARPHRSTFYAIRWNGENRTRTRMHHLILFVPPELQIDHIDGNGLNNQRSNLRYATSQENSRNQKGHFDRLSSYKGVSWSGGKWRVRICVDGRNIYLGRFKSEEKAALAYNNAALLHFGQFARLNVVCRTINRADLMEKLIAMEKGE